LCRSRGSSGLRFTMSFLRIRAVRNAGATTQQLITTRRAYLFLRRRHTINGRAKKTGAGEGPEEDVVISKKYPLEPVACGGYRQRTHRIVDVAAM
jgi:hypothetical protein